MRARISLLGVNAAWIAATACIALFGGCFSDAADPHSRQAVRQDECTTCHQTEANDVVSPVHLGPLAVGCATCHGTMSWAPSTFEHPWPLEGIHATTECTSCHGGESGVYPGTPTACVDCHIDDFDASTYPGHNLFPETCADCHTPSGWSPAIEGTHPDDIFPISTGAHAGIACMDCHDRSLGDSAAGMNTVCTSCHTHERTVVDAQHSDVPAYLYDTAHANFCLSCHPSGTN